MQQHQGPRRSAGELLVDPLHPRGVDRDNPFVRRIGQSAHRLAEPPEQARPPPEPEPRQMFRRKSEIPDHVQRRIAPRKAREIEVGRHATVLEREIARMEIAVDNPEPFLAITAFLLRRFIHHPSEPTAPDAAARGKRAVPPFLRRVTGKRQRRPLQRLGKRKVVPEEAEKLVMRRFVRKEAPPVAPFETDDPAKYIRQVLDEYRSPKIEGMPTFTGGLTGYFSYDYMKYQEPTLKLDAKDTDAFR